MSRPAVITFITALVTVAAIGGARGLVQGSELSGTAAADRSGPSAIGPLTRPTPASNASDNLADWLDASSTGRFLEQGAVPPRPEPQVLTDAQPIQQPVAPVAAPPAPSAPPAPVRRPPATAAPTAAPAATPAPPAPPAATAAALPPATCPATWFCYPRLGVAGPIVPYTDCSGGTDVGTAIRSYSCLSDNYLMGHAYTQFGLVRQWAAGDVVFAWGRRFAVSGAVTQQSCGAPSFPLAALSMQTSLTSSACGAVLVVQAR